MKKASKKDTLWQVARKKYKLTESQIYMAKALGNIYYDNQL